MVAEKQGGCAPLTDWAFLAWVARGANSIKRSLQGRFGRSLGSCSLPISGKLMSGSRISSPLQNPSAHGKDGISLKWRVLAGDGNRLKHEVGKFLQAVRAA
jgi:hypothetical protein